MPEIIKDGKTGYLVQSVGEMIEAVRKVNKLDRRACREHVKSHFSERQMVEDYEAAYHQVLASTSSVKRLGRKVVGKVQRSVQRTTEAARKRPL
jgi:hypothetical protein